MAQESNTFSTYDAVGNREDLADIIYNIDPTETPFMTTIGKRKVKSKKHEWQIDTLASASDTNYVVEGDEFAYTAAAATSRVFNYCQISRKNVIVSGTQEVVDKAGRDSEFAYQIMKRGLELKRDQEKQLLANNASVAGDDSTARELGGFSAWLETNVLRGSGGADGGFNSGTGIVDAATDGTQREFTVDLLGTAQQQAYTAGGKPRLLMVGPVNKRKFSGFEGIAALRSNTSGVATIIDGADVYVGDFGKLTVVVDLFQPERSAFLVDPEYVSMGVLRPLQKVDPAKTGDNLKKILLVEYTLIVDNEAAHAQVADLTTS